MYMNGDMKPTDMWQIVFVWSAIIFKNLTASKINWIIQMSRRSQKDAYNFTDLWCQNCSREITLEEK